MNDKFWRHKKTGGMYKFLCNAQIEATLDTVVVYQNVETGTVWVRPTKEFFDGRFEPWVKPAVPFSFEGTSLDNGDLT